MKGRAITYSDSELAWIKANAQMPRAEALSLFSALFHRTGITVTNFNALCKRKGWLTGRNGRFSAGQIPLNKGKKMPFNPNSARTQFKTGQMPHNTKFAGHERVSKDGYIEISIEDTNPHTGFSRRYVLKQRYLWEQANGSLPEGMVLKCLDGEKTNTDPSNWEAIPRAMLPRLNGIHGRGYDKAPAQIKPTILAITKLEHKARSARKGEQP